ncbi:MAG TPA: hypothetical protein VJ577_12300 [Burkholderiaceae bacterium]|nr:hypothetical protein [Burkholderiaceae bacterium]
MELHQIQITYQMEEDRLLLRASFKADGGALQEIRAWLTRRLVKSLWPGIVKAMETQVMLNQPQAAHARAEIVSMGHQASVSRIREAGGFNAPFAAVAKSYPLGETPVLVTAAHFDVVASQPLRIHFTPKQGTGFEIALRSPLLHGFCSLLQEAVRLAKWDIALLLPGIVDTESASRVLN